MSKIRVVENGEEIIEAKATIEHEGFIRIETKKTDIGIDISDLRKILSTLKISEEIQ